MKRMSCPLAIFIFAVGVLCASAQDESFSPWSPPVNLGPVVNTIFNDNHMAISKEGTSLYFTSNRPGGFGGEDIWVSQRETPAAPWGPPQNLGSPVNTAFNDRVPNFSPDGHRMYFGSTRSGGCGGIDLWVSRRENKREDFAWQAPVNLGCIVNSAFDDDGATYFEDEATGVTTLYFTSARPGGLGDFDIYSAEVGSDGSFEAPVPVPELNSPARDTRTAIRKDGLEMFVTSDRPGGFGLIDLWVSTRTATSQNWSIPVNLGSTINTAANDGAPALSFKGTDLYFYSTRGGGLGGNDLYVATREKLSE